MPILTANEQKQSPELVTEESTIPIVDSNAKTLVADSVELPHQGQDYINHPQLRTKVHIMKLGLAFFETL